jgi:hypothetical protein
MAVQTTLQQQVMVDHFLLNLVSGLKECKDLNMKQFSSIVFVILIITVSCFKEDERVTPYPNKVTTISDSVQVYQSYFDFESGRVVKSERCDAWQLGFECSTGGWHITVNSGANWFIYNTGQTALDVVQNMPGSLDHLFDIQHAFPDSTAVSDWVIQVQNSNVYSRNVYLLGKYLNGNFTNIKQLVFLEVNDTSYRFFYKEKESGITDSVSMMKTDSACFVYYSFYHRNQVNLEPDKSSYDLVFGPYYDMATLFGMTIPYQVGGVFQNTWQTEAVLDSTNSYAEIGVATLPNYNFVRKRDIPGYRWKGVTVDITGGGIATYAVKTHYNYVIHTAQDNYFKLRFLSYTLNGKSGFPQFEFRKLE